MTDEHTPDALVFKGEWTYTPLTEREKDAYEMGEIHGQSVYRDWLLAKVKAHFRDTLPPYIWSTGNETVLPGMNKTTVNEALMGVWYQAKVQMLELIEGIE